jgi:hypothetical protein
MIEERNRNDLSHFFCLGELRKSKERLNKAGVHIVLFLPYIAKKEERKPFFVIIFYYVPTLFYYQRHILLGPHCFILSFARVLLSFKKLSTLLSLLFLFSFSYTKQYIKSTLFLFSFSLLILSLTYFSLLIFFS